MWEEIIQHIEPPNETFQLIKEALENRWVMNDDA
jgi:hypothetical protein